MANLDFDDLIPAQPGGQPSSAAPAPGGASLSFDDLVPAEKPYTYLEQGAEALKGYARGAQSFLTSPLKGIAGASAGKPSFEPGQSPLELAMKGDDRAFDVFNAGPQGAPRPATADPLWHGAEAIEETTKPYIAPAPGWEKSWTGDIAGGFGSLTAGILTSMASGPTALMLFATGGMGEAAERAQQAGATPEQVQQATRLGTIAGATDVVDALLPALGSTGKALGFIQKVGLRAVAGALAEGTQEGFQQWVQNKIAQGVYKPDQDQWEDVPRSAAIGAIVGGTVSGGQAAFERKPAQEARARTGTPTKTDATVPDSDTAQALAELDALLADETPVPSEQPRAAPAVAQDSPPYIEGGTNPEPAVPAADDAPPADAPWAEGIVPAPSPVPETPETLSAQQEQLLAGERAVQMFPKDHPELPVPNGIERIEAANGDVFHYDPDRADPFEILTASNEGRENELLGLGPVTKTEAMERAAAGEPLVAVTERTPDGVEVRGAVGTEQTVPGQIKAIEAVKSPGNTVQAEDPREVIDDRQESPSRPTASWVIRDKATGDVIMETFDRKKVDALNTAKYEAVPIQEHLAGLNKPKAAATERPAPLTMAEVRKEATEYPSAGNFAFVANRKYGLSTEKATKIWNEARAATPKPKTSPRRKTRRPLSLIEFIAYNGGISANDPMVGDVRSIIGTKNKFIPGFGALIRPTGKPLDRHREGAIEAGYWRDPEGQSTIRDLLDRMDSDARGNKVYAESDLDAVQERQNAAAVKDMQAEEAQAETDVRDAAKSIGITVTEAEVAEAKRMVLEQRADPEEAIAEVFERNAIAAASEPEQNTGEEIPDGREVEATGTDAIGAEVAQERGKAGLDAGRAGKQTPTGGGAPQSQRGRRETAPVLEPTRGTIEDFGEKIGGARKDTSGGRSAPSPKEAKRSDERPTWAKRYTIQEVSVIRDTSGGATGKRWQIVDDRTGKPLRQGWKPLDFATKEEAEAMLPLAAVARKHRIIQRGASGDDFAIVRDVTDRKRAVIKDGFKTREDATKYLHDHAVEILETKTGFGEEILAVPERAIRSGAERRNGDATEKQFADTFGFRGVEFGNWNNQAERQEVMNHAYDALMDMSDLLGIPPRALSLDGDLGIAFGARGHGLSGARAHYERDYGVINLTKMSGAGSLAHEWLHAVDHYLGRVDTKASRDKEKNERGDLVYKGVDRDTTYISHGMSSKSELRDELRASLKNVFDTIRYKAEQYVEDTEKAEKFLAGSRKSLNDALDEVRRGLATTVPYGKRFIKPATPEQLARFDAIKDQLLNGDGLETKYVYGKPAPGRRMTTSGRWSSDALEALSGIMKEVRGRSGFAAEGKGPLDRIGANATNYRKRIDLMNEAKTQATKTRMIPTEFMRESRKIDEGRTSDYWSTPHEMAARAFSAYVEDKVAERGEKSEFLSYGSDNAFYRIFNMRPFPEGKEREALGKAFDQLFDTFKLREGKRGPDTALYSVTSGKPPFDHDEAVRDGVNRIEKFEQRASGKTESVKLDKGTGDQFVIPGAERETQGKQAQRKADAPLKPKVAQKKADFGLFGDDKDQGSLFSLGSPFYSAVGNAVENAKQAKAPAAQWMGMIRNAPGVKPEELEWLGVEEWLKDQKGAVTKDAVLDYVRANKIDVKEVEKGGADQQRVEALEIERAAVRQDLDEARAQIRGAPDRESRLERVRELADRDMAISREISAAQGQPTKFSSYTLPGGENYRELLLTLPTRKEPTGRFVVTDGTSSFNMAVDYRSDAEEIVNNLQRSSTRPLRIVDDLRLSADNNYKSVHWDDSNVLAHVRFNDRTVDGKRTLFIEEVQSDWHQAGKRKGYKDEAAADELREQAQAAGRAEIAAREKIWRNHSNGKASGWREVSDFFPAEEAREINRRAQSDLQSEEFQALVKRADEARAARETYRGTVPDAPFKTTWPELAMKRMIRYAAENGYDQIAWTPGDVQAARYDLSKQIKEIDYIKNPDGTYRLGIADKNGEPVGALPGMDVNRMTLPQIEETVGKEIAKKIENGDGRKYRGREGNTLEGLDLKVGGEGMLGFYDQILPATVNKLVKKYGARVGRGGVPDEDRPTLKYVGPTRTVDEVAAAARDRRNSVSIGNQLGTVASSMGYPGVTFEEAMAEHASAAAAEALGGRMVKGAPPTIPVHTLDITPALREAAVSQGFPLFDAGRDLTPRAQSRRKPLEGQLTGIIRRIVGNDVRVSFPDTIALPSSAQQAWGSVAKGRPTAAGSYVPADRLIQVALRDPRYQNQQRTSFHEAFHAVEHLLLTDREMAVLRKAEPKLRDIVQDFAELTPDQAQELADYEVRAIAFEAYADARANDYPVTGFPARVRSIFDKLRNLFERVRNMLSGQGFKSAKDVFSDAYEGRMAGREAVERAIGEAQADARGGIDPVDLSRFLRGELDAEGLAPGNSAWAKIAAYLAKNFSAAQRDKMGRALDGVMTGDPDLLETLTPTERAVTERLMTQAGLVPPAPPTKPPATTSGPSSPRKRILDRIVPSDKNKSKLPTLNDIYTATKDDLNPLRVLRNELAEGQPLPTERDPYRLARLARGAFGKAQQMIENATFTFGDLKNNGKGLGEILKPVEKDLDGFRAYMAARRALELAGRGIKTGISAKDAAAVVREGAEQFAQPFAELVAYQRRVLDYLRDSGIVGPEAYAAMVEANKDYVPFFRLMEEEGGAGNGTNSRSLRVKDPIKGIKGSGREIIDPIESIIKNTYLYVALAEKNRALTALDDLAAKSIKGEQFLAKPKDKTAAQPYAPLVDFLEENDLKVSPDAMAALKPEGFRPSKDTIAFYRNGRREVRQVSPDVAEAVNAMDRETMGLVLRILAAPARMLRAGATLTPEFIVRNPIRDQFTAMIYSESGYIPVYDMLLGMKEVLSNGEAYQNWLKAGGANSALVSMDREYIDREVMKINNPTVMSRLTNVVKSPLDFLRMTSELMEYATRVGDFRRATRKGKSLMEAGFDARELTLDFARAGAQMRAANALIPFFNASIEGTDREIRGIAKHPMRSLVKIGAAITVPSILLWFANHDDDRWKELPQWQKDLFWIVMTKDNVWRIPKPFALGLLFGSAPERVLDAFYDKKPDAFKHLGKALKEAFLPNAVPQIATPVIEQFANRSMFTDRTLVPKYLEGVLPEYQYTPYTSDTARLLGKAIAKMGGDQSSFASPIVIDNYIRSWTGGLGQHAVSLADKALRASGIAPQRVDPEKTWADTPVIKAFAVRHPSAGAQSIQDFYDTYDERKKALGTVKYLTKLGEPDAAGSVQENRNLETAEKIHKALGQQMKFARDVWFNKTMTPADKRQLIDQTYLQAIEIAKVGNEIFRATAQSKKDMSGQARRLETAQ